MLLALVVLAAIATRPFQEERLLLDRRLETLRRILPDGPNPGSDVALVRGLADGAKLGGVEALARPPVESSGPKADVAIDLVALGRYVDVDRFFRQVALSHRLIDVASLTLTATPSSVVRLNAVLLLPYRPLRAALPPAPEGTLARTSGVPRLQSEAYLRDQALAAAKADTIASLRRGRRNPRLFLSEVAAITRDRPVALNYTSLGDEFVVRGLSVGNGPLRALESRFERGFFRLSAFLVARQGACLQFEARGLSPVVGPEAELPLPTQDPFDQAGAACKTDRDSGRASVVRNSKSGSAGKGPLSLRLRDLDVADVFRVLSELTPQAFVVDGDVTGRISIELSRVSLDEALATLAKTGLVISGPGPVRRVSRSRDAAASKQTGPSPAAAQSSGPPVTLMRKRAEVRELLARIDEMQPTLPTMAPQGPLGRVSVWARGVASDDLRAALLAAAGFEERIENVLRAVAGFEQSLEASQRVLLRHDGSEDALVPLAEGIAPDAGPVLRAQDLTVMEFALAGLASPSGEGWLAFAYTPAGTLGSYRAGDPLADGVIKAVESTDVTLETDEGLLTLPLEPLP